MSKLQRGYKLDESNYENIILFSLAYRCGSDLKCRVIQRFQALFIISFVHCACKSLIFNYNRCIFIQVTINYITIVILDIMCEHECYIEVSTRNFVYVLNDNTDEISL